MHPLVVAAHAAEAAHVPAGVEVLLTGVGKSLAAVAVTRAVCEHPRRSELVVLNLGTAGTLRPGVRGVHEIGRVLNHDLSADAIRGFGLDPREWLTVDPSASTVLASGDVFVTDPLLRDALAVRADLVDMEGYAVALACHELGVAAHLVKSVSDEADESAADWAAALDGCARELGAWVADFLARDAETSRGSR